MSGSFFHRMIIAEIGSVHDGSFGNALKLIDMAAQHGANAVKFQTHIAEDETLPNAPMPAHFKGEPRLEYFKRTGFSVEQWIELAAHCALRNVVFLSSPFSHSAVDLLEKVGVGAYKIASGEVSNLPLLRHIAATGKPVLLSSGMSNWAELDAAVACFEEIKDLTLLQCTSAYPCPPERVGLNVISEMQARYNRPVGLSDHGDDCAPAFAAAALGAVCVEKHVTFSKLMYGSDAPYAMEPHEFSMYCKGLRGIWTMLDHPVDKDDLTPYADMKRVFEKSVVTLRALPAGHVLTPEDVSVKKPGNGIPAASFDQVLGQRLARDVKGDALLSWDDIEKSASA